MIERRQPLPIYESIESQILVLRALWPWFLPIFQMFKISGTTFILGFTTISSFQLYFPRLDFLKMLQANYITCFFVVTLFIFSRIISKRKNSWIFSYSRSVNRTGAGIIISRRLCKDIARLWLWLTGCKEPDHHDCIFLSLSPFYINLGGIEVRANFYLSGKNLEWCCIGNL